MTDRRRDRQPDRPQQVAAHPDVVRRAGPDRISSTRRSSVRRAVSLTAPRRLRSRRAGLNVTVPLLQDAWSGPIVRAIARRARRRGQHAEARRGRRARGQHRRRRAGARPRNQPPAASLWPGGACCCSGPAGGICGVLAPLLLAGPAAVTIANRTPDKAAELALRSATRPLHGRSYDEPAGERFDLLINATAAGLSARCRRCPKAARRRCLALRHDVRRRTDRLQVLGACARRHTADGPACWSSRRPRPS